MLSPSSWCRRCPYSPTAGLICHVPLPFTICATHSPRAPPALSPRAPPAHSPRDVSGMCQAKRVSVDFTAIDFETANNHPSSACSVGMVRIRDGKVVEQAYWLIRPPVAHPQFLPFNIKIHGITPAMVETARDWSGQLDELREFIGDDVTVAHNASFDMGVIRAACAESVTPTPRLKYLCSVQVSRKTYEIPSHRLPLAAAAAGFGEFAHHDALADAEACAAIITDAARRHEVGDVAQLVRATGLRIQQLKAIPLKL
ncbi:DNA polymerase-3 subunit epsilon [Leucobacter luti]|uniref:DNA polymerase-3 subunit epsilon n=1 Tax=Leucobacter luti TaxID=340320 RepID=A0A4R6S7P9_9MICO|nr:DNA polymerase-3 subunit epsilon [Leucobacter luti]